MTSTDPCLTYGHCYCQPLHVGGKLHVECCMCQHRKWMERLSPIADPPHLPGASPLMAALQDWQKTHPPEPTAKDLAAHLDTWCGGGEESKKVLRHREYEEHA